MQVKPTGQSQRIISATNGEIAQASSAEETTVVDITQIGRIRVAPQRSFLNIAALGLDDARSLLEIHKRGLQILNHDARNSLAPMPNIFLVLKSKGNQINQELVQRLERSYNLLAIGEISGEEVRPCLLDEWCAISEQPCSDPRQTLQACVSHSGQVEAEARTFLTIATELATALRALPDGKTTASLLENNAARFYTHIESGGVDRKGKQVDFDPNHYAQLAVQSAQSDWIGGQMHISFIPQEGVEPVQMDPVYFQECIHNLLSNSAKAFQRAGIPKDDAFCTVRVVQKGRGAQILTEVYDNGPGIADEHLSNIFQIGFSTSAGEVKGEQGAGVNKGIGLSAIREYVENAGGTIGVVTSTGDDHGTTFTIGLPPVHAEEQKPVSTKAPSQLPLLQTDAGFKVLVVDQNSDHGLIINELFDAVTYGRCKADHAQDIETALEMMKRESYDVVLSDVYFGAGNLTVNDLRNNVAPQAEGGPRVVVYSKFDPDEVTELCPGVNPNDILVKTKENLITDILPPGIVKDSPPQFNILIIDSNQDYRISMRNLFEVSSGGTCRIDTAPDVESAAELLGRRKYNTVIADIGSGNNNLPDTAVQEKLDERSLSGTRLVICSVYDKGEITSSYPQIDESNIIVKGSSHPNDIVRQILPAHLIRTAEAQATA